MGSSLFKEEVVRAPKPFLADEKARREVLRQGFTSDRVPSDLDAIVIGSGMGGLTAAALMSRAGKKVLVLEQHYKSGGCTHTFWKKGIYEFDVGFHYIGGLGEGKVDSVLMEQLGSGQIQFESMDKTYDEVVIGDEHIPINSGEQDFIEGLSAHFPDELPAIQTYTKMCKKAHSAFNAFAILKLVLPAWLSTFLIATGLIHVLSACWKYFGESLQSVTARLTDNPRLRTVFGYCFGDFGTPPRDAPFMMQALLMQHFQKTGAYYVTGGASEIPIHIIPTIEESGGRVLVRAPVSKILLSGDVSGDGRRRAVGVSVQKGEETIDIFAPVIISTIGIFNTFSKLLPDENPAVDLALKQHGLRPGHAGFNIFVGLRGNKEELGLKARNYWIFTEGDMQDNWDRLMSTGRDQAGDEDIPLLFVSFPSAKDKLAMTRLKGMSTCQIVTFLPYAWFVDYEEFEKGHRGPTYESIKGAVADRMWEQCLRLFPQLKDKVEVFEVASPVTNNHYLGVSQGEIYGLDHSMTRFKADNTMKLQPKTHIKGLFLSGQDVFTVGITGAMMGGVSCASQVLNKSIFLQLLTFMAKRNLRKTMKNFGF